MQVNSKSFNYYPFFLHYYLLNRHEFSLKIFDSYPLIIA